MLLGYVLAVFAAVAQGTGSILESIGVRRSGAYGGRAVDLVALRHQPMYFLGLGIDLVGFAAAAAALHKLPLFLVQSALAFSVGVTATISAFLGTRLAVAGWVAVGVGAAGLFLLGISAEPSAATALPAGWRWTLLGMVVPVALIAWYARSRGGRWSAPALAFASGLAFSVVGISARGLRLPDPLWRIVFEPLAWTMLLSGLAAAVVFAMALQKGSPTSATAIMFTTNTTLASFIGLVYLGDQVRPGFTNAAVTGFVLAIGGAIAIAHYAAVAREEDHAAVPERA
ncbi:hypothetical protein [Actinokineospora sp. HUAS TT18]|uniref:hypothetical protein n=1 Tax=Actinokineospora sp. HUAS TT18 TaxID=3447451 RepID=UPI003F528150